MPAAPPPPPPPAVIPPPPTVLPTEVSQQTQSERKKKLQTLQYGLSSTLKTGPRGITGGAPELQPTSQGRTVLG
jgi:hypothetical protein